MEAAINIINERVDDIPILMSIMDQMNLASILNVHFPTHGNWSGLDLGSTTQVWLTHILSRADHRLYHVQEWSRKRLRILGGLLNQPVRDLDFTDDRLGDILKILSNDEKWNRFEGEFNKHLLYVYDLPSKQVRLDATSVKSFGKILEDGLIKQGHSKDHRPDLGQYKIMLSTLDPLGLPLSSMIVSGEKADDPLYLPVIKASQADLQKKGLLFIGDCKMSSTEVRSHISKSNDYYLCPLSAVQIPKEDLQELITQKNTSGELDRHFSPVIKLKDGEEHEIAQGFEIKREQKYLTNDDLYKWNERLLIVQSYSHAKVMDRNLDDKLKRTVEDILQLNVKGRGRKPPSTLDEMKQRVQKIISDRKVDDLLILEYKDSRQIKNIRAYKDKPARVEEKIEIEVSVSINENAVSAIKQTHGWRAFATNAKDSEIDIQDAVLIYRDEYLIEHNFARLKGRDLSIDPLYLQRDDHIKGLTRLLLIALRILLIFEYQVRRKLAEENKSLAGIYPGNPKRSTKRPSAELLLRNFKEIDLTIVYKSDFLLTLQLTELTKSQKEILRLCGFSIAIYRRLCEMLV